MMNLNERAVCGSGPALMRSQVGPDPVYTGSCAQLKYGWFIWTQPPVIVVFS